MSHRARQTEAGVTNQPPLPRPLPSEPAASPRAVGSGGLAPMEVVEPLCAVFRRKLKSEGLKYTPERARILDMVMQQEDLFEADRLVQELRGSGFRVSKATVYRTIKLLQDAGIIQRVLFDQDQAHYQLVYGRRPNDLLIRIDTNEVIPIEMPELIALRERLCRERGLVAQSHRFQVFAVGVDVP